jgi:serine/threonine protein kinase
LKKLLEIFKAVCNAIRFSHSRGVVHLDIKPANIQVGDYGDVLLLDWGLAKYIQEVEPVKRSSAKISDTFKDIINRVENTIYGEVKGTPGYMAPEQAAGQNNAKTFQTDIYSLGAVLYNILTYKKPIAGTEINEILEKTIDGKVIPPTMRSPERNVPKPLEAVVMKAMATDATERYESLDELLYEIDAYESGRATNAEQAGSIKKFLLLLRRNKALSFFILTAVIAIFASVWVYAQQQIKQRATWGAAYNITPNSDVEFKKNWIVKTGRWGVKDKTLIAEDSTGESYRIYYNKSLYGNIALEFDAMVNSPKDLRNGADLSVMFSADLDSLKDAYYLQLGGLSNTSAIIQRNGAILAIKPFSIEAGRKYHIRAEKEGESLRIFCDGELILSVKDIFYKEGGYAGVYTFGEGKRFWNIKLFSKGVSELVSPISIADGYYRESRAQKGKLRDDFLRLAREKYSIIYSSFSGKSVGLKALLKRAYIDLEQGNLLAAQSAAIKLSSLYPSLDQIILRAEVALKSTQFDDAYKFFSLAVNKYPENRVGIVGVLMSNLTDQSIIKKMTNKQLNRFWKLYALNQSNSILRCSNKFISSLEFVRELNFSMIDCSQNFINSLSPLKDMNALKRLDCADNDIYTLEPISNLKLEYLECFNNPRITSLQPLIDMPLKTLVISGCKIKDVSPLAEIKTLERLCIPRGAKGIEKLKSLPNLKYLSYSWDERSKTVDEFWREYYSK